MLYIIASLDHSRHTTIKYPSPALVIQQFLQWYHVLAIMLFLWASYHQHRCHKILANLRKPTEKKQASPSSYSPNASNRDTLSDQKQQLRSGADKNTNTELRKSTEKKSGFPYSQSISKEGTLLDPNLLPSGAGADSNTNVNQANTTPKYGMPAGDWFYYVSCPHLFAEILIYLSLLLCQVWSEVASSWWLVVAHVTCSLFLSARQMHRWYQNKFEDYPKNRTSLFPGIC